MFVYCEDALGTALAVNPPLEELVGGRVVTCLNGACVEGKIVWLSSSEMCEFDDPRDGFDCYMHEYQEGRDVPMLFTVTHHLSPGEPKEGDFLEVSIFSRTRREPIAHKSGTVHYRIEDDGCGTICHRGTLPLDVLDASTE